MKKIIVTLAIAAFVAASCSSKNSGSSKLRTDVDSVAYVIGMNVGMNLLKMDSTLNIAVLCDGIRDVFAKTEKMTPADAETFYLTYLNYSLPEKARAYEQQFLEDFAKSNRAYARTRSGVTYAVNVLGDQQEVPASDRDSIQIRYVIRTVDGTQLYSSYDRKDTLRTTLGSLHSGLQESVRLIGKGGKINTWIPSSEAYGADGDKTLGIQPNATLYYEVELVGVDKYLDWSRRRNNR